MFFAVFKYSPTSQNVTITSSILFYLFIGQKGFIGEVGERGSAGFDGIQGKKGASGDSGISGFAGKRHHSEMLFWVKAELCLICFECDYVKLLRIIIACCRCRWAERDSW